MLPYHSHASHAFAPMPFSPPFFLAFLRLQIVANWFCPPSQITSLPMASDNLSKIQISPFWWLRQLVKSSLISDHDNISIISRQRSVPKVPFHISISPSTSSHPYPPSSILTTHTISSFFHITHSHITHIYIHTLPTHIQDQEDNHSLSIVTWLTGIATILSPPILFNSHNFQFSLLLAFFQSWCTSVPPHLLLHPLWRSSPTITLRFHRLNFYSLSHFPLIRWTCPFFWLDILLQSLSLSSYSCAITFPFISVNCNHLPFHPSC